MALNGLPGNITSFWKFSLHRYDEYGFVYRPDAPAEIIKKIEGFVAGMRSNDRGFKKTGTAVHSSRSDFCRWIHAEGGDKHFRPFNADERDLALGFPAGASMLPAGHPKNKLGEEFGRCLLSGNAWAPPAAAHVFSHLSMHILKNQAFKTNLDVPGFKSVEATLNFFQPEGQPSSPKGGGRAADDLDQLGGPTPVAPGLPPSPGSTSSDWDRALRPPLYSHSVGIG